MTLTKTDIASESWPRCPQAAAFFEQHFRLFAAANPPLAAMAHHFRETAGVSLLTLVDHWALPETAGLAADLTALGFIESPIDGYPVWEHPHARLPRVRLDAALDAPCLALAAEDVSLFLEANGLLPNSRRGGPNASYEEAHYPLPSGELAILARRGYRGFRPSTLTVLEAEDLTRACRAFRERVREGDELHVLHETLRLFQSVSDVLGQGRAVDEFFAAERVYYMSRNRAAQWQYARQQELGIGWANHDHHTYRSSRTGFRRLMHLWQAMGFEFRERFYAGAEAGWGAQILEHPISRVVIFADVDMAPEELEIDFACTDLPPRDRLGTIGLWCALHDSSIGAAGMHHLECEFDFARSQMLFEAAGFKVMSPFTDLPMLKQAFTEAEVWRVPHDRVTALVQRGQISTMEAERFTEAGAPGSHLEILQRWDGFKGFNKTGVSNIILETDARRTVEK